MGNIFRRQREEDNQDITYENNHLITNSQYSIINEKKINNENKVDTIEQQNPFEPQYFKPKNHE